MAVGIPAAHLWPELALAELPEALRRHRLVLVEFAHPACLFSRLWQPVRRGCARTAPDLPTVRCVVAGDEAALAQWRVGALPAMVLFEHARARRRWIGATDWSVLAHAIAQAMPGQAAP